MPELPEVETTLQAIKLFEKETLSLIKIHNPNLRWPVDRNINKKISNKKNYKIYDLRNLYSPTKMKKNNINYYSVGR